MENVFSGKQVLITGGLGFIGSSLAKRLVALRAHVTLVDSLIPEYGGNVFNVRDIRSVVNVNIADVRDPFAMAYLIRDKDYLFNLAGQTSHVDSMNDPHTDMSINVAAQLAMLECCRKHNPSVKIVFGSTRQVYGRPRYLPVDEDHPIAPVDVNGVNKIAGENYHMLYHHVYGIRSCSLRLTNTYGPGMRIKDARQTFLGDWIRRVVDHQPMQVFGNGRQLRDFNYVDDVVAAMLAAAASNEANGAIFNLGSQEVVSLEQLAAMITDLYPGSTYEVVPYPKEREPIDIGDYFGDYRRIEATLGWRPRVSLKDGLRRVIDFYLQSHSHYCGKRNDSNE